MEHSNSKLLLCSLSNIYINTEMIRQLIILSSLLLTSFVAAEEKNTFLYSPDKTIVIEIATKPSLKYKVEMDHELILDWSGLSLSVDNGDKIGISRRPLRIKQASHKELITAPFYKKKEVDDNYNQLNIFYAKGWKVEFRAYNDGVVYRFVRQEKGDLKVISEQVEFNFPGDYKSYVPYVRFEEGKRRSIEEQLNTSFESVYNYEKLSELDADRLMFTPLIVEHSSGKKVCILESDLESYPGMFLRRSEEAMSLQGFFAHYPAEEKIGGHNMLQNIVTGRNDFLATVSGARSFPWRGMAIVRNEKELPGNDLVYKLASPSRLTDTSWIKPGKVAWEWWNNWGIYGVDFEAGINTATYKHYIDFAAEYGLEYVIVDEGWTVYGEADLMRVIPELNLAEIVEYGKSKNVGIILWGGYRAFDRDMDDLCRHYATLGVKGFKIDFIDRDDQKAVDFVYRAAQTTAKYKLLLDLHGVYKPTGLNRTYPNVISFEAVHGLETCKWTPMETVDQVVYEVTMPFIRMVAGPVDYTQGAMDNRSRKNFRVVYDEPMSPGTRCRQLAQYIVYESPLSMLCDSPNKYRAENACTRFMASIPTVWDDTVVLDGKIGEYIAIARRSGDKWYIGGLTDWNARTLSLRIPMIEKGEYTVKLFADGMNANKSGCDYTVSDFDWDGESDINLKMASGGGFAIVIQRK